MTTETNSFPATGGCACGKVRYQMETSPIITHCCHCTWCQRESGASYAINTIIEASKVTILPPRDDPSGSPCSPIAVSTPSLSGRGQVFYRCPTCYVAVWSNYAGAGPNIYFIRAGTLDDAHIVKPDVNIYTSSKLPWVEPCKEIPTFDEFYRPLDVWSKEVQERFAKAKETGN